MHQILLVEDHDDTREMVAELLRGEGYEVVEAQHGQDALELLMNAGRPKPNLVLLDMAMPVMGGGELLAILDERGMLSSLPVVVLSASSKPDDAVGARAFLRKPATSEQIFKVVREFCL